MRSEVRDRVVNALAQFSPWVGARAPPRIVRHNPLVGCGAEQACGAILVESKEKTVIDQRLRRTPLSKAYLSQSCRRSASFGVPSHRDAGVVWVAASLPWWRHFGPGDIWCADARLHRIYTCGRRLMDAANW